MGPYGSVDVLIKTNSGKTVYSRRQPVKARIDGLGVAACDAFVVLIKKHLQRLLILVWGL